MIVVSDGKVAVASTRNDCADCARHDTRGRRSSALAVSNGKAQTVTCHWIDEAGRIASEQQAVHRLAGSVHGERTEYGRRTHEAGGRKPVSQKRVRFDLAAQGHF